MYVRRDVTAIPNLIPAKVVRDAKLCSGLMGDAGESASGEFAPVLKVLTNGSLLATRPLPPAVPTENV